MNEAAAQLTGTILVVDDDPAIRDLIVKRLEHHRFQAITAGDGEEALDLLARRGVDLVLLDIMMPGPDGYEVLERIRAHNTPIDLPVIMVSAKDQGEDVMRAMHRGANDYAFKPIDFKLLLQRITRHLLLESPRAQVMGGYRILQKIGEGGMGVVCEAVELAGGRPVALEILPRAFTADPKYVERFAQAATLARRVHHENIVEMYGTGVDVVPRSVDRLLAQMMAPNAEHRPMSGGQITAAIDAILAGVEPRRRPVWPLLAGAGVVVAVGLGVLLLWRVLSYG